MEKKYLVVRAPLVDEEVIAFSACTDHSWVAKNHKVISAGKFSIYPACPSNAPNPQISVTQQHYARRSEGNSSGKILRKNLIQPDLGGPRWIFGKKRK